MKEISYSKKKKLLVILLFLIFPRLTLIRVTHIFRISNYSEIKHVTYKFSRFVFILDVPTAAILVIFKTGGVEMGETLYHSSDG
jgi:hypothetical protein